MAFSTSAENALLSLGRPHLDAVKDRFLWEGDLFPVCSGDSPGFDTREPAGIHS
jgi:hypothetical protein